MRSDEYPYQVAVWMPGNNKPGSLLEKGVWVEEARCSACYRAEEIAEALKWRYPHGVRVGELVTDERGRTRIEELKHYTVKCEPSAKGGEEPTQNVYGSKKK